MPALLEFAPYALVFGALLLAFLAVYLVRWLEKINVPTIGVLAGLGSLTDKIKHAIEQALTNAVAAAYQGYDKLVGASLHQGARLVDRVAHVLDLQAAALLSLTKVLPNLTWTKTIKLAPTIVKTGAKGLAAEVDRLAAQVQELAHDVAAVPQAIPQAVPRVIPGAIPALRKRVGTLEGGVGKVWDYIRSHAVNYGTLAFAGAVAVALARMGGTFVRCRNTQLLGRRLCGLDKALLDSLLLGTLAIIGTLSIRDFANAAIDTVEPTIGAIQGLVRELHGIERRSAAQQGFVTPGD